MRQCSVVGAIRIEQSVKALVVARFKQMDKLRGNDHIKTLDGVGGQFACDANGAGFGRA